MQNIILILLSLLIIVVLGIIFLNYKKMNNQHIQIKKLELDISALRNFIENRIMTQFPSASSFISSSLHNQNLEDNDLTDSVYNIDGDEEDNESIVNNESADESAEESADESADESDVEESNDESDDEESADEDNVNEESVNEESADESDQEESDDESDKEENEEQEEIVEINSKDLQEHPNVDINLMESIMMLGGQVVQEDEVLEDGVQDEDVVQDKVEDEVEIIIKPRSKKPSENPNDYDEGTIIKSSNDNNEYILKVNKKGKKRWSLVKS